MSDKSVNEVDEKPSSPSQILSSEASEIRANEKSVDGKTESRSESKTNPFDVNKLWEGVSAAAKSFTKELPEGFSSLSLIGASDELAVQKKLEASVKAGAKQASVFSGEQIDNYFQFRDGKAKPGPEEKLNLAPSPKTNDEKAFQGKYNDNNELVELRAPSGKTYQRISPANENGFAYWQVRNEKGEKVRYGSASDSFVGKLSLDKDGAHIMIGHDKRNPANNTVWAGTFVEARSDGSETRTRVLSEGGKATGLEFQLTQKDGKIFTTQAKYEKSGALKLDGTQDVHDKSGDWKFTLRNGEVIKRDLNLLAKERVSQFALSLDSNEKLRNLRKVDLSSRGDRLHVVLENSHSSFQQSAKPGTVINGTRVDGSTMGKKVVLDAQFQQGRLDINVDGITGHGAKKGPLGRRWWSGSSEVHSMSISEGRISSTTDRGTTSIDASQLNDKARQNVTKEAIEQSGALIKALTENSKNVSIERTSARSFKMSMQPSETLQAQVKEGGILSLSGRINGEFAYDRSGFKISGLDGVRALDKDVKEIIAQPGRNGKLDYLASYVDKTTGKTGKITIPESQVKQMMLTLDKKRR